MAGQFHPQLFVHFPTRKCERIEMVLSNVGASRVPLSFIQPNGTVKKVDAKVGNSLMEVGLENDVGIVGEVIVVYTSF